MKKLLKVLVGITSLIIVMGGITMVYFAVPNEQSFEADRELFPYESYYLTLDNGSKIHYIDEGKGPTLLLLHGNPTWSFLYRDIIAALKSDFRLIAPDYPGFGLSEAPKDYAFTPPEHAKAISEFLQKLDLKDIGIMMQDWGGPIGFDVAIKNPERVKRLIIGNTWAWPLERTGQKAFSMMMGGWAGQLSSWCCNGVVRFFMRKGVVNKLSDAEMAMYLAPFGEQKKRSPTHISPAQLRDASPFLSNIHKQLSTLSDRPTLIVWGLQDFAFQEPERLRFETLFPQHTTVLLENAGHFIQEDAPDEIAESIHSFYQQNH